MKDKKSEDIYSNWVKDSGIKDLTGNQSNFVKMIILNRKYICEIGSFNKIFISIYKYLKNNREKLED